MANISNEYDYLIHLVRCGIHGLQPQEPPKGLVFELVFEYGKFHQVANIAFYSLEKLKNKPSPDLYQKWQAYRDQALMCDIVQSYAAQELRDGMQSRGIRYMEVQGTKLKPLYPQSDFRTMSDIDFIIDGENIPKVRELMEGLGYDCESVYKVEMNGSRHPSTYVEIHTEYFLEDFDFRRVMHSPFEDMDEQGQCRRNAFYLYNLLHIAKHYFYSGCGIRRVLDVYFLNQKYPECIHDPYVQQGLESAGMLDFVEEFTRLSEAWFGYEKQEFPRSAMATYIFNAGIHGSYYNRQQLYVEERMEHTGPFAGQRYYIGRLLGNRRELLLRYPVLRKCWLLYPFCWLHRVFSALSPQRFKSIRREIQIVKKMEKSDAE